MKNKEIRELTDFILLNACCTRSLGLYNGKTGMALALFEVSRYLHDYYLEEQAFDLFQEALLAETEDISFENGLSGIGWTLLYLIENKLIDADFDEVFGQQYNKIKTAFARLQHHPTQLLNSLKTIYFLSELKKIKPETDSISSLEQQAFEAAELYLSIQFLDFKDLHYINNKINVLKKFETYLRVVDYAGYTDFSQTLLDRYDQLYRSNKIARSYPIGCYLENITHNNPTSKYKETIADHKKEFLQTLCIDSLPLHERIDFTKLQNSKHSNYRNLTTALEDEKENNRTEQNLAQALPPKAFRPGYEHGLSRYLIFKVNPGAILL